MRRFNNMPVSKMWRRAFVLLCISSSIDRQLVTAQMGSWLLLCDGSPDDVTIMSPCDSHLIVIWRLLDISMKVALWRVPKWSHLVTCHKLTLDVIVSKYQLPKSYYVTLVWIHLGKRMERSWCPLNRVTK